MSVHPGSGTHGLACRVALCGVGFAHRDGFLDCDVQPAATGHRSDAPIMLYLHSPVQVAGGVWAALGGGGFKDDILVVLGRGGHPDAVDSRRTEGSQRLAKGREGLAAVLRFERRPDLHGCGAVLIHLL